MHAGWVSPGPEARGDRLDGGSKGAQNLHCLQAGGPPRTQPFAGLGGRLNDPVADHVRGPQKTPYIQKAQPQGRPRTFGNAHRQT